MDWQICDSQTEVETANSLIQRFLKLRQLPDDDISISKIITLQNLDKDFLLKETNININSIKKAKKIINQYIKDKKPIIVYGDYDVDGICATATLWQTLNQLKARVLPFLPKRDEHGYGLSERGLLEALRLFPGKKPLVITVDNGITGAAVIKKFDLDFIITDHHQIPAEPPKAKVLIHSTNVSGTGVAYVFSSFLTDSPLPLDLVALATICDQMPLTGLNRQFLLHGLPEIQKRKRLGLKILIEQSGISLNQNIDTYHLGFIIGPRLNASGRLGHALDALRLLCTNDEKKATEIAINLNSINQSRQELTQSGLDYAIETISKLKEIPKIIIVHSPDFHEGIIGLIAAKISEKFNRPTIAISEGEEISKASARSIPGLDITTLLRQINHVFVDLGGHDGASGFTILTTKIKNLKEEIIKTFSSIEDKYLSPHLNIDLLLHPKQDLNEVNIALKKLSPFGPGFKEPLLSISSLELISHRAVGVNFAHLQILFKHPSGQNISAIGFNQSKKYTLVEKNKYDCVFFLNENHFNGKITLQLNLQDLK